MAWKSFKKESRTDWGLETDAKYIGADRLQLGAILRIADATELMAKSHQTLISERDYYKRRLEETDTSLRAESRRNISLRGVVTRLKNQKRKVEASNAGLV